MRVPKWDLRLNEVIEAAESKGFEYGSFDCALFAADCVDAMTGLDYAADLRGYQSKIDAYRIISTYGSIEDMITALLQRKPIHPAFARRGDVVLGTPPIQVGEAGESIGICLGLCCAFPASHGLAFHPLAVAHRAWRID